MLAIAWQTVRGKWVSFAGMSIALLLSVGLLTVVALVLAATFTTPAQVPGRFMNAPTVVYPTDVLNVETSVGLRTARLEQPGNIPAETVSRIQALGQTVIDRAVLAQMITVNDQQAGRAWSSAAFGPSKLVSGREPQADNEVVVNQGQAKLHEPVRILISDGVKTYIVSGLARPVSFELPIYFTDAEAARLSPLASALVSFATPETIRRAVGESARVLTGAERYLADPDPYSNQKALNSMQILLGVAGGFTTFVAIFVVASTFAFVTTQRQREFALLRAMGATPAQVRRMVLLETVILGLAASLGGVIVGVLATPLFATWLKSLGVAPSWFEVPITWLPAVLACVLGLGVAILGTLTASLRASKSQPLAALRAASLDERGMARSRWIWAYSCLVVGLIVMVWIAFKQPRLAIIPQIYFGALMLPIVAVALFAPAIVPSLTRLITWPLSRIQSVTSMLVRQNALTAVRRTVATAVPVLLTVGLFMSLLGATNAITAAKSTELIDGTKANYVVLPDPVATLSSDIVAQIQAVPGITAVPVTSLSIFSLDDNDLRAYDADAIDPMLLATVLDVPLEAGSLADFRNDTIVVGENWGKEVGQKVDTWFADGTKASFTVVAVMKARINPMDAYITSAYAGKSQSVAMYVKANAPAALQMAVEGKGVKALPVSEWAAISNEGNIQAGHIGMLVTLGIVGVYSAIALINILVISTAGRMRDMMMLHLAGATRSQIYWFIAAESLLVVVIGTVLAMVAFMLNTAAHQMALDRLVANAPIVIPWATMGITVGACAILAVVASVASVALALHKRLPKVHE